jgi:hypothetical protein
VIHAISLGAGVQSSAMALMFAKGHLGPMPDCAIFADTQDEEPETYAWLDYLEPLLPFPIYRVSKGKLSESVTRVRTSKTGTKYLKPAIPVFIDGGIHVEKGKGKRQCTYDYKIEMVTNKLKELAGVPRNPKKADKYAVQYMGISLDEVVRMKPHHKSWATNEFPLVFKLGLRRHECVKWLLENGFKEPPRSACIYCPFHNDAEWGRIKAGNNFQVVVDFEKRLQKAYAESAFRGIPYLHKSCVPIGEADFDPNKHQTDLFGNECEGMCGV